MMKFKILLIMVVIFFVGLSALIFNYDNYIFKSPGISERLRTYFTMNNASVASDHVMEELRTPIFDGDVNTVYNKLLTIGTRLGWEVAANDKYKKNITFVVRSPVFMFADDVFVQVQYVKPTRSALFVQSISRKGIADLGANSGHIRKLVKVMRSM